MQLFRTKRGLSPLAYFINSYRTMNRKPGSAVIAASGVLP